MSVVLPDRVALRPPLGDRRSLGDVPRLGGLPSVGGPRPARVLVANASLIERRDLTAGLAIFLLRPDAGPLRFQPGQYVSVGLPTEGPPLLRPYSVASPDDGREDMELLIRRADDGALTSRLWTLRRGARLFVGPARGLFTLRADDRRRHLLAAAGTGLAPLMAMLARLAEHPAPPPTTLLHGVSLASELAYGDRLHAWAAQGWLDYRPSVSRPEHPHNAGWTGRVGRIDGQLELLLAATAADPEGLVAYLCGNDGMVAAARRSLAAAGVPDAAIHAESFTPPRRAAAAA
jgi:ferredoxin-NADP reductase